MPGITCAGLDTAGGIIKPGGQSIARINGFTIAVVGDAVNDHGSGQHRSATLVQGSVIARINGVPIVLAGMRASCGDVTTGNPAYSCSS